MLPNPARTRFRPARSVALVRALVAGTALLLAALLAGCVPGASALQAPTFRVIPEASGLQRLDPPGIGSGSATFRIELAVANPNPVGLRLAGLDGDLLLGGRRAASTSFAGGVDLPARGESRLTLDVAVPLAAAPAVLADLAGLFAGDPLDYRVDALVTVDLLGAPTRFPRATLARGEIAPLTLAAPRLAFLPAASGLRELSLGRATVGVAFEVANPGPVGYRVEAPRLELALAGVPVGSAAFGPLAAPARGAARADLEVSFNPVAAGVALASQLQALAGGGGGVQLALRGPLALEAPGLGRRELEPARLIEGTLR